MPGGDKTGPTGQGPMTGRGLGPCKGSKKTFGQGPGNMRGYRRRGLRKGFGRGYNR